MSFVVDNITVTAEGRAVVRGLSLSVEPGAAVAIIGANGAGKSEAVLGLAGVLPVKDGKVQVDGQDITNQTPDSIRKAGVAVVPEGHQVLDRLTVDENLRAAGALLREGLEDTLTDVYTRFPELAERKSQNAGSLSGGQQQMVAISHALMCRPKFLVIDEMSLGLAPLVVKRLIKAIETLKFEGLGIVLIEQFTDLALSVCEHAIIMRNAEVTYAGASDVLRDNPKELEKGYFGAPEDR